MFAGGRCEKPCVFQVEQTLILLQLFPLEESVRDLLDKAIVVAINADDSGIEVCNVRCVPPQILIL